MISKNVCVIGLGYIGLPTAALIAKRGYKTIGIDQKKEVVKKINDGYAHIAEPELDNLVKTVVEKKMLKALTSPVASDIYIICVPTPFYEEMGVLKPDLRHVFDAINSIKKLVKSGDLIIIESTCPVGTTSKISETLRDSLGDMDLHLAYCPERVLPGNILTELMENDRIVGGVSKQATEFACNFYRSFVAGEVFETDASTAEMCKLAENSFRDVNIAFANELSIISANAGIDVWGLIDLANKHPRVNILQPGSGVGGHCIAVDPWFIVDQDPKNSKLIKVAREVNISKTKWVINQIISEVEKCAIAKNRVIRVGCFGLTFKPDVDDLRESPAEDIALALHRHGVDLLVVEPNINSHKHFKLTDLDFAIKNVDLIILLVKHKSFIVASKAGLFNDSLVMDFCGATKI